MPESRLTNNEDSKQGLYPSVFKKIDSADYKVHPFQTNKSFTVVSGSSTSSLLPLKGFYTSYNNLPAIGSELIYNDAANIDNSLQSVTYFSINHLFYKRKKEPANTFGPTNLNRTKKHLFQTASVFSFPQDKIGEGIKQSSLIITASDAALYGHAFYGGSVYGLSVLDIRSDRYGNLYDANYISGSIITGSTFYEGFNEYFDSSRVEYKSSGVTYVDGISTTSGLKKSIGLAAEFSGSGYIQSDLAGFYDRNNDYCISLFISGANSSVTNELVIAKASSSRTPQYPFKLELSGSNHLVFSAAGSDEFKTTITSSTAVTEWTHVVCQKTGSKLEMYLDGTLHSSVSSNLLQDNLSPFTASARIDNKWPLYVGGFTDSDYLHGKLDELRIFNKAINSTQVGYLGDRLEDGTLLQTNHIGNVFTKQGIAVISTPDYRYDDLIQRVPFTASYRSTKTIHELNVLTRIDAGDFNMSSNLTLTKDNDETYKDFATGSIFSPYITTIGLYNDAGQLLAIGKPAQPIKKRSDVDINFVVQLDLDKNITYNAK
tara:strand:+ start:5658 stop:7289 length:1632 start_codon:yes stop_codon:yes gene_type:complete